MSLLNFEQSDVNYDPYNTQLSPEQEILFRKWKNQFAPNDSGIDYDFRGAFLSGLKPDANNGHWPDTYKKPNHQTFSNESKYAQMRPDIAGNWTGENYTSANPNPLLGVYLNLLNNGLLNY
jgi:hypothetical protein